MKTETITTLTLQDVIVAVAEKYGIPVGTPVSFPQRSDEDWCTFTIESTEESKK